VNQLGFAVGEIVGREFPVSRPATPGEDGGDDGTRTRGLCCDSLGVNVLSATYVLTGAAKSLKRTVGTV